MTTINPFGAWGPQALSVWGGRPQGSSFGNVFGDAFGEAFNNFNLFGPRRRAAAPLYGTGQYGRMSPWTGGLGPADEPLTQPQAQLPPGILNAGMGNIFSGNAPSMVQALSGYGQVPQARWQVPAGGYSGATPQAREQQHFSNLRSQGYPFGGIR